MDQTAVKQAIESLINEALYGKAEGAPGTMFAEDGEALFQSFPNISAEEASKSPGKGVSTIAAHTLHAAYYIHLALEYIAGKQPKADWEGSWAKQEVTPQEWVEAQQNLESKVKELIQNLRNDNLEGEGHALGAIAQVAHISYHLGSIRQIHALNNSK